MILLVIQRQNIETVHNDRLSFGVQIEALAGIRSLTRRRENLIECGIAELGQVRVVAAGGRHDRVGVVQDAQYICSDLGVGSAHKVVLIAEQRAVP